MIGSSPQVPRYDDTVAGQDWRKTDILELMAAYTESYSYEWACVNCGDLMDDWVYGDCPPEWSRGEKKSKRWGFHNVVGDREENFLHLSQASILGDGILSHRPIKQLATVLYLDGPYTSHSTGSPSRPSRQPQRFLTSHCFLGCRLKDRYLPAVAYSNLTATFVPVPIRRGG